MPNAATSTTARSLTAFPTANASPSVNTKAGNASPTAYSTYAAAEKGVRATATCRNNTTATATASSPPNAASIPATFPAIYSPFPTGRAYTTSSVSAFRLAPVSSAATNTPITVAATVNSRRLYKGMWLPSATPVHHSPRPGSTPVK